MLLKVIACDVFTREICHCVAITPHIVDLEFTPKGAHDDPEVLHKLIQERIDAAEASEKNYEAIALCLGLCGNSTVGLKSRGIPLVIPRAHDCCSLFLGSRERWKTCFGDNPSTPFSSAGYIEHGGEYVRETDTLAEQTGFTLGYQEYVDQYGEENAAYIWETLHPAETPGEHERVVFIDMPECPAPRHIEACREKAEAEGKEFVKLEGSLALIRGLVFGEWDVNDFLIVPAGSEIAGVYDWDTVIKTVSSMSE
ncbi:MAG: DUF1638 domain-containing protein [Lentisphaerae bacterium]|nr:DUF1638 domain-containing protein [Lentisphaerota bacterium]